LEVFKVMETLSNPFLEPTSTKQWVLSFLKQQLAPNRVWTQATSNPKITSLTCYHSATQPLFKVVERQQLMDSFPKDWSCASCFHINDRDLYYYISSKSLINKSIKGRREHTSNIRMVCNWFILGSTGSGLSRPSSG
jgi:hypothetical protein